MRLSQELQLSMLEIVHPGQVEKCTQELEEKSTLIRSIEKGKEKGKSSINKGHLSQDIKQLSYFKQQFLNSKQSVLRKRNNLPLSKDATNSLMHTEFN